MHKHNQNIREKEVCKCWKCSIRDSRSDTGRRMKVSYPHTHCGQTAAGPVKHVEEQETRHWDEVHLWRERVSSYSFFILSINILLSCKCINRSRSDLQSCLVSKCFLVFVVFRHNSQHKHFMVIFIFEFVFFLPSYHFQTHDLLPHQRKTNRALVNHNFEIKSQKYYLVYHNCDIKVFHNFNFLFS